MTKSKISRNEMTMNHREEKGDDEDVGREKVTDNDDGDKC